MVSILLVYRGLIRNPQLVQCSPAAAIVSRTDLAMAHADAATRQVRLAAHGAGHGVQQDTPQQLEPCCRGLVKVTVHVRLRLRLRVGR